MILAARNTEIGCGMDSMELIDEKLFSDVDFVKKLLSTVEDDSDHEIIEILERAGKEVTSNKELMLSAISANYESYQYIDESLKSDKLFFIEAEKLCGYLLQYADKDSMSPQADRSRDCARHLPSQLHGRPFPSVAFVTDELRRGKAASLALPG